jgi:hypothetical protein
MSILFLWRTTTVMNVGVSIDAFVCMCKCRHRRGGWTLYSISIIFECARLLSSSMQSTFESGAAAAVMACNTNTEKTIILLYICTEALNEKN